MRNEVIDSYGMVSSSVNHSVRQNLGSRYDRNRMDNCNSSLSLTEIYVNDEILNHFKRQYEQEALFKDKQRMSANGPDYKPIVKRDYLAKNRKSIN